MSTSEAAQPERSRRRPPRRTVALAFSVLVAIACAAAFYLLAVAVQEDRIEVLAAAVPLTIGHSIAQSDLTVIEIGATDLDGLGALDVDHAEAIIGQVAAIPLSQGALITADVIGTPSLPEAGRVQATLLAADGRWPQALEPGQSIAVLAPRPDGEVWRAEAIVTAVTRPDNGGALISVDMAATEAVDLAIVDAATVLIVATSPAAPGSVENDASGERPDPGTEVPPTSEED